MSVVATTGPAAKLMAKSRDEKRSLLDDYDEDDDNDEDYVCEDDNSSDNEGTAMQLEDDDDDDTVVADGECAAAAASDDDDSTAGKPGKIRRQPTFHGKKSQDRQFIRDMMKVIHDEDTVVPRMAVNRLTREIAEGMKTNVRFQKGALAALHFGVEAYMVSLMEMMASSAAARNRTTITPRDLDLVRTFNQINAKYKK